MSTSRKSYISAISPIYDEEENVQLHYQKLSKILSILPYKYEIIFVNDGSTDGSSKLLSKIAESDTRVKIIELNRNYGQTAAISAGIAHATGEIVVLIDSDLQNDPNDIPSMLDKIKEGYDVVSGWRENRKDSLITKKIPSVVANWIISFVLGVNLHDYGCTLKAYRKEVLNNFNLYGEMHRFIPAYAALTGAKITEIPVNHYPRKFGKSHYSLSRVVKVIFDLITTKFLHDFSTKPLYFFGTMGLMIFLLGILLFVLVTIRVIFLQGGWISPMILLSGLMIILSFQFIFIGLLAEILIRIYFESQKKTPYIVKRTMNL